MAPHSFKIFFHAPPLNIINFHSPPPPLPPSPVIELAFQTYTKITAQAAQSRKRHLGLPVVLDFRWLGGAENQNNKSNMAGKCIFILYKNPRGPTRPHEAYEISKSRDF
jgi:hypothetical protein